MTTSLNIALFSLFESNKTTGYIQRLQMKWTCSLVSRRARLWNSTLQTNQSFACCSRIEWAKSEKWPFESSGHIYEDNKKKASRQVGFKTTVPLMQLLCYVADRNFAPPPKMLLSLMIDSNHKTGLGNKNNDQYRRKILSSEISLSSCGLS